MVPIPESSESHSEESEFTTYSHHDGGRLDPPEELTGSGGCHRQEKKLSCKVSGACELSG